MAKQYSSPPPMTIDPNKTYTATIDTTAGEARKAVRYQHKYGADLIKFTATGGVLSIGDSGDLQQFSDTDMKAIVDAARMLGMTSAIVQADRVAAAARMAGRKRPVGTPAQPSSATCSFNCWSSCEAAVSGTR